MNVYAKFRNVPLRINKALRIFQKRVTTPHVRRTTTVVALNDPSGPKISPNVHLTGTMKQTKNCHNCTK